VVLSNIDGCVVAANALAKSLNSELLAAANGDLGAGGFAGAMPDNMMFQPYFKVKWLLDKHQAAVFSSNYELYADMSQRMHNIIGGFSPHQEVYSIDESFLGLQGLEVDDWHRWGWQIKQSVDKQIGVPVAVGIGPTKTLAKLANHLAKNHSSVNANWEGVYVIEHWQAASFIAQLKKLPIQKVWGIGKRLAKRLQRDGLETVWQFQQTSGVRLRRTYGVMMERTWRELHGEVCFQLYESPDAKQQIIASRSFGQLVMELSVLQRAVVSHLSRALEKLRHQRSLCQAITVSIRSNPFSATQPFYHHKQTIVLTEPTDNDLFLAKQVRALVAQIWQPEVEYHKAGVVLGGITPSNSFQLDLFSQSQSYATQRQQSLMTLMDQVNRQQGAKTLFVAAAGSPKNNQWQMLRNKMSPRYTTNWHELAVAHAK